jgi:hypothetical protein
MNPLPILNGLRELIDPFLRYFKPFRGTNLLAD